MNNIVKISFILLVIVLSAITVHGQNGWHYFRDFDLFTMTPSEEIREDSLSQPCVKILYKEGRIISYCVFLDHKRWNWSGITNFYYENGFILTIDTIPAPGPHNYLDFMILGRDTLYNLTYRSEKRRKREKWMLHSAHLDYDSGKASLNFQYPNKMKWQLPTNDKHVIKFTEELRPLSIEVNHFTIDGTKLTQEITYIRLRQNAGIHQITSKTERKTYPFQPSFFWRSRVEPEPIDP